jgi:hypothetical protein
MGWGVWFESRDFSRPLPAVGLTFRVRRLTWSDEGGPQTGEVQATGDLPALESLVERLRCPVTVLDDYGAPAWWGYVHAVQIFLDGVTFRATLEGMANRVAVRWADEDPQMGEAAQAYQHQTAWLDDLPSQRAFGVKEMIFSLGEASQAEAEAACRTHLMNRRLPQVQALPGERVERPYAVLDLRGWFDTLRWRFWSEPRGYVGNIESGGRETSFGHSPAVQRIAQSFSSGWAGGWELSEVWVKLWKVGAPTDQAVVSLCADQNGLPGAALASVSLSAGEIASEPAWVKVFFPGAVTLTGGTMFWVALARSGGVSATQYFGVRREEDARIPSGAFKVFNGSAWVNEATPGHLVMGVLGRQESTEQLAAIAGPAGGGQFLQGVRIRQASGVKAHLFRAGKWSALDEVRRLLSMGTASGEELLAQVSSERVLVVEKRPNPDQPALRISPGGEVVHLNGRRLLPGENPVGKWAVLDGLVRMDGKAGAPEVVYLTHAEWRDGRMRVGWE